MAKRWQRGRFRWRVALVLLQETDVEHVVDAGADGQGEANGDVVDELGDAVRPTIAGFELATGGLR
jgi:hypothetical protein